jgi:hypothetical protein
VVALLEAAFYDEEVVIDAQVIIKDPIFLITIEDGSTHSTIEVKT